MLVIQARAQDSDWSLWILFPTSPPASHPTGGRWRLTPWTGACWSLLIQEVIWRHRPRCPYTTGFSHDPFTFLTQVNRKLLLGTPAFPLNFFQHAFTQEGAICKYHVNKILPSGKSAFHSLRPQLLVRNPLWLLLGFQWEREKEQAAQMNLCVYGGDSAPLLHNLTW